MVEFLVLALIHLAHGQSTADDALLRRQASAALAAEKATGVDAYLLLGLAFEESRFQPWQVSYESCVDGTCVRSHASLRKGERPPHSNPTYYCGVTQVGGAISWDRCEQLMNDIEENYLEAAKHLKGWMRDPSCASRSADDRVFCALLGNGGGYPAIRVWDRGEQHHVLSYPVRCLRKADLLRRFVAAEQASSKT